MRQPLCFIIFILLFHTHIVLAQNLRGVVSDASNKPISGASIFIKELNFGLITNSEGRFQANLEKGQYSLICKAISYNEISRIQIVQDEDMPVEITLTPNKFSEHRILKKDTIAERVIKKAIRKRPDYKYYKASSYIKGDLVMTQISKLTNKLAGKIGMMNILDWQNKPIHQEIYSDIKFQAPDIYSIQVTGYSGNIADELNQRAAIGLLDESLYSEKFNNGISPLNPKAFSYYKYRCTETYEHNGQKCYIVKVESKKNDPELLNGELHIIEDGNINYSQLTRSLQAFDFTTITTYYNIDNKYNIPVTHQVNLHMHAFGNSGKITYLASLKYESIERNIISEGVLEEEGIKFDVVADEDSIFWNEVRTLPVSPHDTIIFEHFNIKKYNSSKPWFGKILMGDYIYGGDSSKWSVGYGGVKMIFRDYNYVDGFWLGQRFYIKSNLDKGKSLEISPYLYYTTARHRIIGGSDLIYSYLPERNGKLTFAIGSHTSDFNNLSITRYNNYFSSLFLGKNYNSFYQRDYVTASNDIDLTTRLKLSASLGVERRGGLTNHTDFTIAKVKRNRIIPNIYPDKRFDRTFYSLGLSFSPYANYTIENNEPPLVFHLEFEEGFSAWQTNNSRYKKLKGGVVQNIRLNYFDKFDYKIEGGAFIGSRKHLHFADYQFYGSPDLVFNLGSLFDSFLLLDNYELQANHYWINLSLNYSGKYVLLKRLSFLQGKPFFEGLHFKTLYTPDIKFYSEIGYSLNVTRLFGIGIFSSFNNFDYKNAGVRFSLNLQSLKILKEQ